MAIRRDCVLSAAARKFTIFAALLAALALPRPAHADNAFDLSGPQIQVRVTRAGKTLAISQVPNLQPGDELWLRPVLPDGQSVRFLLIASFLRGSTNPPPSDWFTKAETWKSDVSREGIKVTIPPDAQQALLFLAPETGGDFSTLRSAVRSRPGSFVRAAMDLDVASLNRTRLEKYLDGVQDTANVDPKALEKRSTLLARSLNIKIDQKCFDLPREQQASCLMQDPGQLVMDDQHTASMVTSLTSGSASDLIGQVSTTPMAGGGAYSPYVGAIVDVVRIMDGIHTAQYQYLPALGIAKEDSLSLKLNNPPSFKNPKSVLVIGLPAVTTAIPPPLRSTDSQQYYCLQKPSLVLPVEGAPLVFSTSYAHDVSLLVRGTRAADASPSPSPSPSSGPAPGQSARASAGPPPIPSAGPPPGLDLPAIADAQRGGFAIDSTRLATLALDQNLTGTLHGSWGFDSFNGPTFHLQSLHKVSWNIATADRDALVVGHDDTLHVHYDDASCIDSVTVKEADGKDLPTTWKLAGGDQIDVQFPLQDATPGKLSMVLKAFGQAPTVQVPLDTYADAARVDAFTLHAGDETGRLSGTRLDQVASLTIGSAHFVPDTAAPDAATPDSAASPTGADAATGAAAGATVPAKGGLLLTTHDAAATALLHAGARLSATVTLKDGRELKLPVTISSARPSVALVSKSILQTSFGTQGASNASIRLSNKDDLPQDARLSFFLRSQPSSFPRDEKIEVAAIGDDSLHTLLSLADGTLTLQDSHTVLATFDPQKSFGESAFGPLHFRAVGADGTTGAWLPLANLVRVPSLKNIQCPDDPDTPCTLNGTNLFLIDSVASNKAFANAATVPPGMAENTLSVPRPNGTVLYLKLRDDPDTINSVALPVLPQ